MLMVTFVLSKMVFSKRYGSMTVLGIIHYNGLFSTIKTEIKRNEMKVIK